MLGWCMAHGEGIDLNAEDGFKKFCKAANVGTPDYAVFALESAITMASGQQSINNWPKNGSKKQQMLV